MEQPRLNPGILALEPGLFNPYIPNLKTRGAWGPGGLSVGTGRTKGRQVGPRVGEPLGVE